MALDGHVLAAAIKAALDAVDPTDRVALFNALETAITDHIKDHAVVSVTVVAGSGSGTVS